MPKMRTATKKPVSFGVSTAEDVAAFKRASEKLVRRVTRTPETARAYLISIGVLTDETKHEA